MKQSLKYVALLAILPLAMVALAPELIEDASAQKSEGNPNQKYGSETKHIVCGDRLCSTPEGSPEPGNIGKAK